jgi:hypothetical protein
MNCYWSIISSTFRFILTWLSRSMLQDIACPSWRCCAWVDVVETKLRLLGRSGDKFNGSEHVALQKVPAWFQ